jgi:hypothetical protein
VEGPDGKVPDALQHVEVCLSTQHECMSNIDSPHFCDANTCPSPICTFTNDPWVIAINAVSDSEYHLTTLSARW